jgi:hypothetical protein
MAQDLSPAAVKAFPKDTIDLVVALPKVYLPSLPKTADELGMYCIVVGFLLRTWLVCNLVHSKVKQSCPGLAAAVDKANLRRKQKIVSIKGAKAMEVRSIIDAEERMMKIVVMKLEAETGVV